MTQSSTWPPAGLTPDLEKRLEERLGRVHARQRLGIEREFEARAFGHGLNFFHIENWYSVHNLIRTTIRLSGLYGRGRRNAGNIRVRANEIALARLPAAFDGFTILHVSDMHADISPGAMARLAEILPLLDYDICALTGDFRGRTSGAFAPALDALARVRAHIAAPVYAVLGNHDTVCMVPGMEEMGIRLLMNEAVTLERDGTRLHIAGIDDAHYFRVDNIEKAASGFPHEEASILLSHTPEIFRQAAHADFDLMLSGHTHGGQICLPGGIPVTLDARLPRRYGRGAWRHGGMAGYTSAGAGTTIVPVRLNCPPEITVHTLRRG